MIDSEDAARAFVRERVGQVAFDRLCAFTDALLAEAETQNLIARNSFSQVWQRHIADSVQLLAYVPRETSRLADFGSGAGLPGIVLSICRPELTVRCYESRAKRIAWLGFCKARFDLRNCSIEGGAVERAQTVAADCLVARAFAPMGRLLDMTDRFGARNACWVLPRGRSAWQDAEIARENGFVFHVKQSVTQANAGILVGGRAGR